MSMAEAFVHEARQWAKELCRQESRGPGDYSNAMRRVARKASVPFGLIWNLHYRPPKTISADIYASLGAFYVEQRRRYREETKNIVVTTSLGRALLSAANHLAGEKAGLDPVD
jgi:hypothetical protein